MKQDLTVILLLAICALVVGSANVTKQGLYKGDSVASELCVEAVYLMLHAHNYTVYNTASEHK